MQGKYQVADPDEQGETSIGGTGKQVKVNTNLILLLLLVKGWLFWEIGHSHHGWSFPAINFYVLLVKVQTFYYLSSKQIVRHLIWKNVN